MPNFPPQDRDRLGAEVLDGAVTWCSNNAITPIPNNETIVILNWMRIYRTAVFENARYMGGRLYNATPHEMGIYNTGTAQISFRWRAAGVRNVAVDYVPNADALYVQITDRDNSREQIWVDHTRVYDAGLAQDPNLSVSNMGRIGDGVSAPAHSIVWRSVLLSLTSGQTPAWDEWRAILRVMRDPDAPLLRDLVNRIGTFAVDWRPGEGIYGTTTVENQRNPGTDDLTWNGGVTVEDVRVRQRRPKAKTRRTYYMLTPGYNAVTGQVDFGFAVQPVVIRLMLNDMSTTKEGTAFTLANAAATHTIRIYNSVGWDGTSVILRTNGVNVHSKLRDSVKDNRGGDLFLVWDGTDFHVYYSGQYHDVLTPVAGLDLTGNCTVTFASTKQTQICRVVAWNPTAVPTTLLDEIRDCCMNPDIDPPSLAGSKRVDFPIRSDLIAAAGTQVVNQGLGGGTLTLGGVRDTACIPMLEGYDP